MTHEEALKDRKNAEDILNNPLFQRVFDQLSVKMEQLIIEANTSDEVRCADVIRYKQVLYNFERIFKSAIKKGDVAEKELALLSKKAERSNSPRKLVR